MRYLPPFGVAVVWQSQSMPILVTEIIGRWSRSGSVRFRRRASSVGSGLLHRTGVKPTSTKVGT